jgi:hypothetical protein
MEAREQRLVICLADISGCTRATGLARVALGVSLTRH